LQFDWVQHETAARTADPEPLAAILYPQLLGLSMGIDEQTLGLSENRLGLADITSYLISE